MNRQEIPSIDCNVLKFFCMPLNKHYLLDLHKKFEIASTAYECRIPNLEFLEKSFLNYAKNRHTHRPTAKKVIFDHRRPQNMSIHQNLHFENLTQNKSSTTHG